MKHDDISREAVDIESADAEITGFALPAAVGALTIILGLVTAGFYMARQEMRMGVASENAAQAFYLAELAIGEVIEGWAAPTMSAMNNFTDTTTFTDSLSDGNWTVDVIRVGNRMYLLDATGEVSRGGALMSGATRRLAMIARTTSPSLEAPAAMTTRGGIDFSGNPPELSGFDRNPTGWNAYCPAFLSPKPGFLSDDISKVQGKGGPNTCVGQVTGFPSCAEEDAIKVGEAFEPFEGDNWTNLVDAATYVIESGNPGNAGPSYNADGTCNTNDPMNWGEPNDPTDACGTHFPVVYFPNNVMLTGSGRGQGIFLFQGDFWIGGNYELKGLIVVKGEFTSAGTPAIHGGVVTEAAEGLKGNPDVFYSSCAVERAVTGSASLNRARPLANRSFVDLSNLIN